MKSNKYFLVYLLLMIIGSSYYYLKENNLPNRETSIERITELKVSDLKDFPEEIKNVIVSKDHNLKNYKNQMEQLSKDSEFHKEIAHRLYTLSMAKGFYSDQKLHVLRMAKEHLLLAKEGGAKK